MGIPILSRNPRFCRGCPICFKRRILKRIDKVLLVNTKYLVVYLSNIFRKGFVRWSKIDLVHSMTPAKQCQLFGGSSLGMGLSCMPAWRCPDPLLPPWPWQRREAGKQGPRNNSRSGCKHDGKSRPIDSIGIGHRTPGLCVRDVFEECR